MIKWMCGVSLKDRITGEVGGLLKDLLLSVYSPFADRVGLPLHNILSPFLSVMDDFSIIL